MVVNIGFPLLLVAWAIPFQAIYLLLFVRHLWQCSIPDLPAATPLNRRRPGWKVSDDIVCVSSLTFNDYVQYPY